MEVAHFGTIGGTVGRTMGGTMGRTTRMKLFILKAVAATMASRIVAALAGFAPFSALLPGRIYFRIPTRERKLYLTFDDGPGVGTQRLIDQLNARQARATFFFTGESCKSWHDAGRLLNTARSSGHMVGFHGLCHLNAWKHSAAVVEHDNKHGLQELAALGNPAMKTRTTWVRPPYGRLTPKLSAWYKRNGLTVALWDVDPVDYGVYAAAADVTRFVRKAVRSGSIILLHENSPVWTDGNGANLAQLIDGLIIDGWILEALPRPEQTPGREKAP